MPCAILRAFPLPSPLRSSFPSFAIAATGRDNFSPPWNSTDFYSPSPPLPPVFSSSFSLFHHAIFTLLERESSPLPPAGGNETNARLENNDDNLVEKNGSQLREF